MNASQIPAWLTRWAGGELELKEESLATLVVVSGTVAACDPMVLDAARAFSREIKPGKYKVALGTQDGELALACVKLSRAKVATWEIAQTSDEREGFSVESGNACFADAAAVTKLAADERERETRISARLAKAGIDQRDPSAWHDAYDRAQVDEGGDVLGGLSATLTKKHSASLEIEGAGGANLVAWKCTAVDGVYTSYWGLDAKGKLALLVTDFGLVREKSQDDEEDDVDDERDEDDDDLEGDLEDLVWDEEPPLRIERPPVASPLLPRARQILTSWERAGKMELEEDCDREALAEALLERLVSLEGHRHLGAHLAEWLMERAEVTDVFASDDELEADIRRK